MNELRRYADAGPLVLRPSGDDDDKATESLKCDACGEVIEGPPAGSGLFLWTRGEEIRYEEPPLCERCAYAIAVGGTLQADLDEEG